MAEEWSVDNLNQGRAVIGPLNFGEIFFSNFDVKRLAMK